MKLVLYHYAGCGFCGIVRSVTAELGLEIELRDILEDPEHERELVAATGRQTVPCLQIEAEDGGIRWMHETTDIIQYLQTLAAV